MSVNYAEVLVKARRYEQMTEAVSIEDAKKNVKKFADNAGENIKSTADNVSKSVKSAVGDAGENIKSTADNVSKSVKGAVGTAGERIKGAAGAAGEHLKNAADYIGQHKKAAVGIGAGLALGAGAAIAAKKIHDKKKAAAQNKKPVKENYEYDEYASLLEAVVNGFMSEDEIMSENANEIAIATADYMIENVDFMF